MDWRDEKTLPCDTVDRSLTISHCDFLSRNNMQLLPISLRHSPTNSRLLLLLSQATIFENVLLLLLWSFFIRLLPVFVNYGAIPSLISIHNVSNRSNLKNRQSSEDVTVQVVEVEPQRHWQSCVCKVSHSVSIVLYRKQNFTVCIICRKTFGSWGSKCYERRSILHCKYLCDNIVVMNV